MVEVREVGVERTREKLERSVGFSAAAEVRALRAWLASYRLLAREEEGWKQGHGRSEGCRSERRCWTRANSGRGQRGWLGGWPGGF